MEYTQEINVKNIAIELFNSGLSVIPIDDKKVPIGSWKAKQEALIKPNGEFNNVDRLGIVTGKISGYLQCIDKDTKYDITGTLFQDYKQLIAQVDKELLRLLTVQQTQSGGYHFLFRCKTIEGNKKLAKRAATQEELANKPKEKTKAIIETRGEGGYIAAFPTKGYKVIYGSLTDIKEITEEQRQVLLDCARALNTYVEPVYEKKEQKKVYEAHKSPFDDYNERGDVLELLEAEGWKVMLKKGSKNLLLRPYGTGKWSADYDEDKRLFYVWTSSSDFENEKAYNPTQVLATLRFNKDYSATAKWLLENGYGEKTEYQPKEYQPQAKSIISLEDDNYEFIATDDEMNDYIEKIRNGTFEMGKSTGFPDLDIHFLFKKSTFVIVLGHDNVGKSVAMWYLATLSALMHEWNWIIFSSENKTGGVKRKIIEFYTAKSIKDLAPTELKQAGDWFNNHFTVVKNVNLYTYTDMLNIGRKLNLKKQYHGFLIDPYNSLDKPMQNEHQYDYKAASEMRLFIEQTKCGIYLNTHAHSEALRRTYPKGHDYEGFPMPPNKADAEGGGKFANKADDFLVFHRMTQHETEWMWMEIHVKKVKEMETGGKPTIHNKPFKMRMSAGGLGYENVDGLNPVLKIKNAGAEKKYVDFVDKIKSMPKLAAVEYVNKRIESKGKEDDFVDDISKVEFNDF
jgi:hypothetical protein